MSHGFDKICIIVILISSAVSTEYLLMSRKTNFKGLSRQVKYCLLNTTTPIFSRDQMHMLGWLVGCV